MTEIGAELANLGRHLAGRREAVLRAWRGAVQRDPALTTGDSLPRSQVYDHIPALLASFERELGRAEAVQSGTPAGIGNQDAAAHGLQRWQQGYDLREVTRELGRLNESMVIELENYAAANPQLAPAVMSNARRLWATLCSTAIEESTAQFFRLQQSEAAGHLGELEKALEAVRDMERQRAELWQQAAHDLRGNLSVVANATAGLALAGLREPVRDQVVQLLQRNVGSLHHLLDDVTSLARLQAGKEQRLLARVDVGALLAELCDGMRPLAQQRHLFLHCEGAAALVVEGDAVKIRRIAQNLILNAIKYTAAGGVMVLWGDGEGDDSRRWVLGVKDTGPGFHAGSAAPVAHALEDATKSRSTGAAAAVVPPSAEAPPGGQGEGIGLSIVKRLCDLLDAEIAMESNAGVGTTFRLMFPRAYPAK